MSLLVKMNKKAQIMDQLGKLAVGVATLAVVLVVAFLIMAEGQDQILTIEGINATAHSGSDGSTAYNATQTLQEATATIPAWVPIIILTAIGALLLSMVAMFRRR